MSGVIQDGWDFVAYAWSLSVVSMVAYAITLTVQLRGAQRRAEQPEGASPSPSREERP